MERGVMPIIDMQKGEGLAEEIVKACEEWGCFRMVNHGVPLQLMAEMKVVIASLHSLPEEIKRRTVDSEQGKGYMGRGPGTPFFETLSIGDTSSPDEFLDCLNASQHQREIIYKYIKATRELAGLLGRKIMEGYGLAGDLFDGWCCQMRTNKYHYCLESIGLIGVGMHSDPSFLTILHDDENVNGLQVVDKYSGEFISVDPVPGTLAVNIGDVGKAWSNGRFCNVKHRICCFQPETRYSLVLFVLGPKDKKVEAPSELVDLEHPRLYVPIDYREYRQVRTSHSRHTSGTLDTGETLDLFSTHMA